MFTPYDIQFDNDAAAIAAGGEPEYGGTPEYAGVRDARSITEFPTGRVTDPLGNRYHRMRPLMSRASAASRYNLQQSTFGVAGISSNLSGSASPIPNRMDARDPEQGVSVNEIPAAFNPASFSTTVTHRDLPLSRSRVDEIYSHHTSRGFAF